MLMLGEMSIMGESKRLKKREHNFGKVRNPYRKAYNTDTINAFRIDKKDGRTWLVTNLELERMGLSNAPDSIDKAMTKQILLNIGVNVNPSKQCWVLIDDGCKPGDIVLGELSHHPKDALSKGFATLKINKVLK